MGSSCTLYITIRLHAGLTLEQYSKGYHTPTSAQPLGAHT
jgi:hypothetical protein